MWKDFFKNPVSVIILVILVTLIAFFTAFMFFSEGESQKAKSREDRIAEMQIDVKIPTKKK